MNGHFCLVLDLRGEALSYSPLGMMLAVGLSCMTLSVVRYIPSIPIFSESFYKWMLDFVKSFFCIYWNGHVIFLLLLLLFFLFAF